MKKLGFLFLLAASAFGQSTAGPFVISSGTSACASISVTGQSAVGISVTGTFTATLQPQVSIRGQAVTNIQVTPSTSTTAQSTITATGNYTASVGGYDTFYVCITAYTSGSATIYLNSVKTTASNGGSGGGGGGASTFPVTGTSAKLTDVGGGNVSVETLAGGAFSGTLIAHLLDSTTSVVATTFVQAAAGTRATPAFKMTTEGIYSGGNSSTIAVGNNTDAAAFIGGTGVVIPNGGEFCWSSGSDLTVSGAGCDVQQAESGGQILLGHNGGSGTDGKYIAGQYILDIPCVSSGGTCGAKSGGFVTIAAAATTVTVATTAVHSDTVCTALNSCSHIHIQEDSTKGAALGVTCNTTVARTYAISTVTNSTSFVITSSAAPAVNPACLSFTID